VTLRHLHRHSEALASLDQALAVEPADFEAWVNRGLVLASLDRPKEAVASFDLALLIEPDDALALAYREEVIRQLPDEAELLEEEEPGLED
jgi:tetratricopeptide (TPR) repeat protein